VKITRLVDIMLQINSTTADDNRPLFRELNGFSGAVSWEVGII
jgi:hypothetical protein